MTIGELAGLLRRREVSCSELAEQTFADIRKRDAFRCFITLMEEQALETATKRDRELAAGTDRGPFHGIPIAVKDLFYTQGVKTTGGSVVFRDFVPACDATVVARLKAAGAILVGKTNLHEIAYGITSKNPHYGWVLNPLDPGRLAGGSSGGSAAAVAAGFVPMALGTDTGGSIRIPSSFCGTTGLMPTYSRVSRHGVLPLAFSLDHVGPICSCVEDCALTMNAIAGRDPRDPSSSRLPVPDFAADGRTDMKSLRIGVPANFYFERLDDTVASAMQSAIDAMRGLGAAVAEIRLPDIQAMNAVSRVVQLAEVAAVYANHNDPAQFGKDVWNLIQQGKAIAGHEYVNAQRLRSIYRREFDAVWDKVDVLVTPTTPTTAPGLDEDTVEIGAERENTRMASTRLVRAINFIGEPALSMPCGTGRNGMPVGLQLIARPFGEATLVAVGRMLETALPGLRAWQ